MLTCSHDEFSIFYCVIVVSIGCGFNLFLSFADDYTLIRSDFGSRKWPQNFYSNNDVRRNLFRVTRCSLHSTLKKIFLDCAAWKWVRNGTAVSLQSVSFLLQFCDGRNAKWTNEKKNCVEKRKNLHQSFIFFFFFCYSLNCNSHWCAWEIHWHFLFWCFVTGWISAHFIPNVPVFHQSTGMQTYCRDTFRDWRATHFERVDMRTSLRLVKYYIDGTQANTQYKRLAQQRYHLWRRRRRRRCRCRGSYAYLMVTANCNVMRTHWFTISNFIIFWCTLCPYGKDEPKKEGKLRTETENKNEDEYVRMENPFPCSRRVTLCECLCVIWIASSFWIYYASHFVSVWAVVYHIVTHTWHVSTVSL